MTCLPHALLRVYTRCLGFTIPPPCRFPRLPCIPLSIVSAVDVSKTDAADPPLHATDPWPRSLNTGVIRCRPDSAASAHDRDV